MFTIYEIVSSLMRLSVGGYFNHEKKTAKNLTTYIQSMFRAGGNSLIMEIALPDGWWLFEITKTKYGFDYWIPDNRDQEQTLKKKLVG